MTRDAENRGYRSSQKWLLAATVALAVCSAFTYWLTAGPNDELSRLVAEFRHHSGARLVFERDQLPAGDYHEVMVPLTPEDREDAARIAVHEAHKFPRRYLGRLGLSAVGIFQACASTRGDGFREFDEELQGYRYYGIYNGSNAIAAAYYSDRQLPLTLNHEIFHHIDRVAGLSNRGKLDARWLAALAGTELYPALELKPDALAALEQHSSGEILEDSVSDYASANPKEDRAETARYLLSTLPDALVQAARRPELLGSQRILHVLATYRQVPNGNGPDINWFVNVALDRVDDKGRATKP